jgi:hypothetical protein
MTPRNLIDLKRLPESRAFVVYWGSRRNFEPAKKNDCHLTCALLPPHLFESPLLTPLCRCCVYIGFKMCYWWIRWYTKIMTRSSERATLRIPFWVSSNRVGNPNWILWNKGNWHCVFFAYYLWLIQAQGRIISLDSWGPRFKKIK